MRISDWSSDVCSSDLLRSHLRKKQHIANARRVGQKHHQPIDTDTNARSWRQAVFERADIVGVIDHCLIVRSEEHTSELQSLMRNSYAVFCLKKKTITANDN